VRRFKTIFQWLLRNVALYLALVLAFAAAPFVAQAWKQASEHESTYHGLTEVRAQLRSEYGDLTRQFEAATTRLEAQGIADLNRRILETRNAIAADKARLGEGVGVLAFYRKGAQALLENQRLKLRIALLHRELRSLEAARYLVDRRAEQDRQRDAQATLSQAQSRCDEATRRQQRLEARWSYRLRSWIESPEHRTISTERERLCGERDLARNVLAGIAYAEGSTQQAQAALEASRRDLATTFEATLADLSRERDEARTRWNGTYAQKLRLLAEEWHLKSLLVKAFWTLAVILAAPFFIRVLFWTVLAPLAERRPAIRLAVPGGRGSAIAPAERSMTSVAVRLGRGEELLVRQSYLQTTSHVGAKSTQWLLDWRHPFASWVSGLTFLTRIRGEEEVTTVSAVRDPFAEVTTLVLPDGASCVLQPRALAAVAQPAAQPLRITSHWRLGSLNAWLTLQLRYLVFHGPCRLVVKGGRGIRVERAESGRVFGQAQLVGFSADLAYSVSRTETFWPYFFGFEQLFKDKVEAGEGILVIEEAPMAGRRSQEARHGLEGAFDVVTKAFGI
jgi:hypothetical protein